VSTGLVFDLKRFALHDGAGIRTTAFLMGCPLSCPWCQNPEGMDREIRVQWIPSLCIHCETCVRSCPRGAVRTVQSSQGIAIDHDRCNRCGVCLDECPSGALRFTGRRISAEELAAELLRDRDFFAGTGGVTLSGGEPLAQPAFAAEVLRRCRAEGVHTAVETTLAVPRSAVDAVLPHVSEFIVDLKLADPGAHRDIVAGGRDGRGVGLDHIRENLEYLLGHAATSVLVRIPMIPGFTATHENLSALGAYIATLHPAPAVELMNFNPLAESKYRLAGRSWPIPGGTPKYTTEQMASFAEWVREAGAVQVTV
jgi:pyruvate formate lyase activating enzyme